eukprot:TRINITY_DN62259_c0_g1_i2.p1 TRINITY_DN62259_c0_g1~~TRINITY_DN62259_c0_g1_i2.p1  ORF type:complete len:227 (-),score=119.75 TRINITY_DN62259_c0_g1_i2:48-728(-)
MSASSMIVGKVLVVGDVATGKTSFIQRYCRGYFSDEYRATIGVDFALKTLTVNGVTIRMQLWDIAGQERFANLTRLYYRDAVAAFVFFDLTKRKTLEGVASWKQDLDNKVLLANDQPIPVFLIGSKADLEETYEVTEEEARRVMKALGFKKYVKTSAKSGLGITEACEGLADIIVKDHFSILKQQEQLKQQQPQQQQHNEPPQTRTVRVDSEPPPYRGANNNDGCC